MTIVSRLQNARKKGIAAVWQEVERLALINLTRYPGLDELVDRAAHDYLIELRKKHHA